MKLLVACGLFLLTALSPIVARSQEDRLQCYPATAIQAQVIDRYALEPITPGIAQPNGFTLQVWATADGDRIFVALRTLHPVYGAMICVLRHIYGVSSLAPEA